MSHKSQKDTESPAAVHHHEHEHDHDDDLIDVPEGKSRLRYIATIGLVLFLLVIFVVADLFQTQMTGGGRSSDVIYITWEDPVHAAPKQIDSKEFFETKRTLTMMTRLGVYFPDSLRYGDPNQTRSRQPEASDEDIASFFIYEDMARDAQIAISDKELSDVLRSVFRDTAGERFAATQTRMTVAKLEDAVRRVWRVNKLRNLLLGTVAIPDADKIVSDWQEQHPEYKFRVVSIGRDDFVATAQDEVVDDETLLAWFHERPQFEQEKLYTEARVTPEVVYIPLVADAAFDATALLAAYPSPEGADVDEMARSYHRQFRTVRFRVPEDEQVQEQREDGADDESAADPTDDGDTVEGDTSEGDTNDGDTNDGDTNDGDTNEVDLDAQKALDQTPPPKKFFYEFAEVEERIRIEAPIHAAFAAFQTDLLDRSDAGEEIDLAAEAERLGLVHALGADGGYDREGLAEVEGWGGQSIASQLVFGIEGTFLPRAVVTENSMAIARVVIKKAREEPSLDDMREQVTKDWALDRASDLAVDALENIRGVLAERPEDVELADWRPEVDLGALKSLVAEAGYALYDRPWLERFSVPDDDFAAASPADQYIRTAADLFELEPGQMAAPSKSRDGETAFLVFFEEERAKDPSAITAAVLLQARGQARTEDRRTFGATVFLGDGAWLVARTKLAFPDRDRSDAERAARAKDAASDDDSSATSTDSASSDSTPDDSTPDDSTSDGGE